MSEGRRRRYPGGRRNPKSGPNPNDEAILSEEEVQRRVNVEGGGRLVPPPVEHKFRDRRPTPVAPRRSSRSGARDFVLLLGLVIAGLVAIGILLPDGPLTASATNQPSPQGTSVAVAPSAATSIGVPSTGGLITLPPRSDAPGVTAAPTATPAATAPQAAGSQPSGATPRPAPAGTPRPTPTRTPTAPTPSVPQTATLVVSVQIVNDSGGTFSAGDWTVTVDSGGTATPSNFSGSEDGTTVTLSANASYSVTAQGPSGYSAATNGDCSSAAAGLPAPGSVRSCRLIRNDVRPRLTVRTVVDNSAGGSQPPDAWTVTVSGTDVTPASVFPGSDAGVMVQLDANAPFDVAMSNPNDAGYSVVESGTCDGSALALGAVVTCTFTYTFEPPPEPAAVLVLPGTIKGGLWGRRRWATTRD